MFGLLALLNLKEVILGPGYLRLAKLFFAGKRNSPFAFIELS